VIYAVNVKDGLLYVLNEPSIFRRARLVLRRTHSRNAPDRAEKRLLRVSETLPADVRRMGPKFSASIERFPTIASIRLSVVVANASTDESHAHRNLLSAGPVDTLLKCLSLGAQTFLDLETPRG